MARHDDDSLDPLYLGTKLYLKTAAIALSVNATGLAGVLAISVFISYKSRQTAKTVQAASLKGSYAPRNNPSEHRELLIKKGLWTFLD